jgi:hypothetical protein
MNPEDVDDVVMVGGSSKLLAVGANNDKTCLCRSTEWFYTSKRPIGTPRPRHLLAQATSVNGHC